MTALSARNPSVQHLRRLARRRRARSEAGAFVIEGAMLVAEALAAGVEIETAFVETGFGERASVENGRVDATGVDATDCEATDVDATGPASAVLDQLTGAQVPVVEVGVGVLARALDTVTPQGLAAIARLPHHGFTDLPAAAGRVVLVLAGVADPGNAGTLLRSAEASGALGVVVTEGSVDVFSPKTVRAAAGSLFRLPVVVGVQEGEAAAALHEAGFRVIGTHARQGIPYDEANLVGPHAIVLGNEAHGLSPAIEAQLDDRLTIPMEGPTESLNVAMAGTLICFEAARQRRALT